MAEKLIPLEDAQSIVLSHVAPTDLVEIPVWQAAGLPLAEDAVADIDISPFANSAMDGYAVRSADLARASGEAPVMLDVIGHEAAGHVFEGTIGAGETVRIMTGAPVPEGADAVVKYEIVDVLDIEDFVAAVLFLFGGNFQTPELRKVCKRIGSGC